MAIEDAPCFLPVGLPSRVKRCLDEGWCGASRHDPNNVHAGAERSLLQSLHCSRPDVVLLSIGYYKHGWQILLERSAEIELQLSMTEGRFFVDERNCDRFTGA